MFCKLKVYESIRTHSANESVFLVCRIGHTTVSSTVNHPNKQQQKSESDTQSDLSESATAYENVPIRSPPLVCVRICAYVYAYVRAQCTQSTHDTSPMRYAAPRLARAAPNAADYIYMACAHNLYHFIPFRMRHAKCVNHGSGAALNAFSIIRRSLAHKHISVSVRHAATGTRQQNN